jgi:spore maturation protein CgeB
MNILYIGNNNPYSTSLHRANALTRVGHNVIIKNPEEIFKKELSHPFWGRFNYKTGYIFIQSIIYKWLKGLAIEKGKIQLIWIDGGEWVGKRSLIFLKNLNIPVVLYNVDDPTGKRDRLRFYTLLKALPFYDLVVVVRKESELECIKLTKNKVLKVLRSYDEEAHKPFNNSNDIPVTYHNDIVFIGTWMRYEKRDKFLLELIESGLNISIWGDRWHKSPMWGKLKPYYKGNSIGGREYVAAIQGAKINIGLLSKGNRDQHTQRSLEIPFAGGLLCAERTEEHLEMYREGIDAVFWNDSKECIEICKKLLQNESLRIKIRESGMKMVRELKSGNEDLCRKILSFYDEL